MSDSAVDEPQKKRFVLDTSAMLTLIEAEAGAERVRALIQQERVFIPFVVVLELRYITLRERGQAEADMRYALLKQIGAEVIWQIDEATLLLAARFKATHRLSLGDAMIAAYAKMRDAVLLHKDPEYAALQSELGLEALPYKAKS